MLPTFASLSSSIGGAAPFFQMQGAPQTLSFHHIAYPSELHELRKALGHFDGRNKDSIGLTANALLCAPLPIVGPCLSEFFNVTSALHRVAFFSVLHEVFLHLDQAKKHHQTIYAQTQQQQQQHGGYGTVDQGVALPLPPLPLQTLLETSLPSLAQATFTAIRNRPITTITSSMALPSTLVEADTESLRARIRDWYAASLITADCRERTLKALELPPAPPLPQQLNLEAMAVGSLVTTLKAVAALPSHALAKVVADADSALASPTSPPSSSGTSQQQVILGPYTPLRALQLPVVRPSAVEPGRLDARLALFLRQCEAILAAPDTNKGTTLTAASGASSSSSNSSASSSSSASSLSKRARY